MRPGRGQFTVRSLMVVVMLVAGGITTVRLVRLSSHYRAQAAKHAQMENEYHHFIADLDGQFLQMGNSGTALLGYIYHQKLAEHHRSLRQAFERASRRPWERAPRDVAEPSIEALRVEFGPPLIQLAAEHRLKALDLSDMGIGRDQLRALGRCTELRLLDLSINPITDQGLADLRSLKKLWRLNLANTRITDAGLDALRGMSGLLEVDLHGTGVTKTGLDSLSRALPNCTVIP
jgi:hypothetical protein